MYPCSDKNTLVSANKSIIYIKSFYDEIPENLYITWHNRTVTEVYVFHQFKTNIPKYFWGVEEKDSNGISISRLLIRTPSFSWPKRHTSENCQFVLGCIVQYGIVPKSSLSVYFNMEKSDKLIWVEYFWKFYYSLPLANFW